MNEVASQQALRTTFPSPTCQRSCRKKIFVGNPIHENIMTRKFKHKNFTTRKFPDIRYVIPLLLGQSQCRHETLCSYSSFLFLGYLLPVLLLMSGWQPLLV